MTWIAVAAIGVTAVGAAVSANGASKNAAAIAAANDQASGNENDLYKRQSGYLNDLIDAKNKKLYNLGNIFDRFESTGAFGKTGTLKNLRKAQEDFSALAAGDFTGFESQLRKSMSDSLVGTIGSGAPVGAYAGLAADTQLQYRKEGIQTAVGISEYLSNEASKLLGTEFGVMDQKFNSGYELDRTATTNMNNYALGKAGTVGVGMQAWGGAIQSVGSAIGSFGISSAAGSANKGYMNTAMNAAQSMNSGHVASDRPYGGVVQSVPVSYGAPARSYAGYSEPSLPSNYGNIGPPPTDYSGGVLPPRNSYYTSSQPTGYQAMDFGEAWKMQTAGGYTSQNSIMSGVGARIASY